MSTRWMEWPTAIWVRAPRPQEYSLQIGPVSRRGAIDVPQAAHVQQAVSRIRGQAVLHPDDAIGLKQRPDGEAEVAVVVASSDV
jgi:hypothetical protein